MSNYSAALQNLTDSTWSRLQVEEKLAVLQAIEVETAEREGRQPCRVMGEFIPSDEDGITLGYYDRSTRMITINTEQLDSTGKYGNDYQMLVNTILHEGRHAYQHQAVSGEIEHDDEQALEAWKDNMQPGHYITYERNPRGYYSQPIEADARAFAEARLKILENDRAASFGHENQTELRLVRDEETLREVGERNIEQILEARRDDLRDKGIPDGPEMDAIIDRERVELQMEFERDAFRATQHEENERLTIEDQFSEYLKDGLSTSDQDARAEIEGQINSGPEIDQGHGDEQSESTGHDRSSESSY